jgi:hypothetical protein
MCCIALIGVWNWRGRNDDGGLTALADWELIHLKARDVYLVFDSDVMTKWQVAAALKRLKAFLEMKGARVHVVYLDPDPTGAKVGLDDFFAAGGTMSDLLARAEDGLRPLPHDRANDRGPYVATPAGFIYRRDTQNGPVDQPLSNFTARIVEEVIADDGASQRVDLAIEGELGEHPLPRILIPTRRFGSLDWVNGEWGARPILAAGLGNRDRVREAIQRHSPNTSRRHVYEHPGWRNLPDHGWSYLHAGGAISAIGTIADVDVALREAAGRIELPEPPTGDDLRDAVRACLSLLDVAPDRITIPLFGTVYRAVLCELVPADISVFAVGPTGAFKSELSGLAMQHFGAGFDRLNLPAQWSSTANALERLAFDFKDASLVIDDFAPHGTQVDVARQHATADRVLRAAGNRGGRSRMRADGTLRSDFPPRGMIIGTGEDTPRGQSLRSRMMILDVEPGDVDLDRVTTAQVAGKEGTFAAGLAGYIQWLAPQFDVLGAQLASLLVDYRRQAHTASTHARTPEAVAHLALGWRTFLRFAAAVGALTQSQAQQTFERVWTALGEIAARQGSYQSGEEPARRFLDLLGSALAAGHVHFASPKGLVPQQKPKAWGWREERVGSGEYERTEWRPQGGRAGWIDDKDLYLDLEAALAGIQRVSQATGNGVTVTSRTLAKRLNERGFLKSTEQDHGDLRVRRTLEDRRRRVLHFAASAITLEESGQSGQSGQSEPESAPSCRGGESSGRIVWPDFPLDSEESRHETRPESAPSRDDGGIGRIGRILTDNGAANVGADPALPQKVSLPMQTDHLVPGNGHTTKEYKQVIAAGDGHPLTWTVNPDGSEVGNL